MTITFVLDKNLSSADATVALASHREGVASDRAFAIARHDRVDDARDAVARVVAPRAPLARARRRHRRRAFVRPKTNSPSRRRGRRRVQRRDEGVQRDAV